MLRVGRGQESDKEESRVAVVAGFDTGYQVPGVSVRPLFSGLHASILYCHPPARRLKK
jgi:hypothetical protein